MLENCEIVKFSFRQKYPAYGTSVSLWLNVASTCQWFPCYLQPKVTHYLYIIPEMVPSCHMLY